VVLFTRNGTCKLSLQVKLVWFRVYILVILPTAVIDEGSSGLLMIFNLPTQRGYDSDAGMAAGEVGKAGVAIDSLRDMEVVFDGIPLYTVSTSMTINAQQWCS